ncbi:MAG: hypothetical protein ACOYMS_03415, partial [Terrimicrobiaceae bacterium]
MSEPTGPSSLLIEAWADAAGEASDRKIHDLAADFPTLGTRASIGRILESGGIAEDSFFRALAEKSGVPWADTEQPVFEPAALTARLALRYHVIPLKNGTEALTIACYDPFDHLSRSAIRQAVKGRVRFVLAPRSLILAAIREHYGVGAETFEELLDGREEGPADADQTEEVNILDDDDAEASVMKFVNQIIREALKDRATDIHVEPMGEELRIRYRIDGMLR